jgi:hypothetical protein
VSSCLTHSVSSHTWVQDCSEALGLHCWVVPWGAEPGADHLKTMMPFYLFSSLLS